MAHTEHQSFTRQRNELISKASPNIYTLQYLEAYTDFADGLHQQIPHPI